MCDVVPVDMVTIQCNCIRNKKEKEKRECKAMQLLCYYIRNLNKNGKKKRRKKKINVI